MTALTDLRFLLQAVAALAACLFAPGSAGCSLLAADPVTLSTPGDRLATAAVPAGDIFSVVVAGLAVVAGSLALAFVARLLNGRPSGSNNPPSSTGKDS